MKIKSVLVLFLFAGVLGTSSLFAVSYPSMGVYKGGRGGSTSGAPPTWPTGDYQGMAWFESWFGYNIPRAIDFVDFASWTAFDNSVNWLTNPTYTGRWGNSNWDCTYSVPMLVNGATLAAGANGDYDSHYVTLAQNLAAGDPTAIVRLGWEMNGTWYFWKVATTADAANFRTYWIRIVTAMRGVAPGLRFDFCPAVGLQNFPAVEAYPGDAYVDFIGLDVYNQTWITSPTPATRWNDLLNSSYGLQFWADFAAAHGKPLSYSEWGTGTRPDGHGGGDDPFFVQNMFNWLTTHNVAFHNYWDYPASDFNGQLSNDQYPNSGTLFKDLFSQSYSIASGPLVSPSAGTYRTAQAVTLSTSTPGGSIRYTLDGTTPTSTTGTLFTGPITIGTTATLKAIAFASGHTSSTVTAATYTIQLPSAIPSTPAGLNALTGSIQSDPQVILFWNPSSGAPTSYNIKRAPSGSGPFTTIGTSTGEFFTDTTAIPGTTYSYVVSGVNSLGESTDSTPVNAAATPSVIVDDADATGVSITGSWTSSISGNGFYGVGYRHDGNTGATGGKSVLFTPTLSAGSANVYLRWTSGTNRASNVPVSVTDATGTRNFTVNQRANGGAWMLLGMFNFNAGIGGNVLVSNDGCDGVVVADAVRFVSPPPAATVDAPTALTATAGERAITLNWTGSTGATRYLVKRAWSGGGDFKLIGTTSSTTWLDQGLTNGTNYVYAVSAASSAGESANSASVSAAPVGLVVMVTSVSSGRPCIAGVPAVGNQSAIDRTYTISGLSTTLADSRNQMILAAYDDKALTTASYLTFSLNRAATVYVCYDGRVTMPPAFLNDGTWTLTTETFATTHTTASPFKVYSKSFAAGSVTLGGPLQPPAAGTWPGGQNAPYTVIIH